MAREGSISKRSVEIESTPVSLGDGHGPGILTTYKLVETSPDGVKRVLFRSLNPLSVDSCPECGADDPILWTLDNRCRELERPIWVCNRCGEFLRDAD